MLNTNIRIIFIKSSSVLNTLFHLIDLDLRCWITKLIPAFYLTIYLTIYLTSTVPCKVEKLAFYGLIFTVLHYDFVWFNFYLDSVAQNTIKKPASSPVTA